MDMTSKEFRHTHLMRLLGEYGTIEALAELSGINPQYLSQCKNQTRGIGNKTARRLEAAVGWPEGAMDRPPEGADQDSELVYLLNTLPGDTVANAVAEAIPGMSEDGVQRLTTALLSRLNRPADSQE